MAFEIIQKVKEKIASEAAVYPVRSNYASEMGHPCLLYLVFNRTRWQEKQLPSIESMFHFQKGRKIEEAALDEIKAAGFQVFEQQRHFEWPEYQISGRTDGKIVDPDDPQKSYPLEVKAISDWDFDSIGAIEDMIYHKKWWFRKYPAQITLYMLMSNEEEGVLYLKNPTTYESKAVWCGLDWDYGEKLIKKAEAVNAHVKAGTFPGPLEWDDMICGKCYYLHICPVSRRMEGVDIVLDEELEAKIERHQELKPMKKEYEDLNDELKEKLKEKNVVVGRFQVTGKMVRKEGYSVLPMDYWQMKIIPLGEGKHQKEEK